MKVRASEIGYVLSDEDVLNRINVVLSIDELNNFSTTHDIEIDNSIFDSFEPNGFILVAFIEIPEIIFGYRMIKEDYDSIYCTMDGFYDYETIRGCIISELPDSLELTIDDDIINDENFDEEEDFAALLNDLVEEQTDCLVSGFSYDIE